MAESKLKDLRSSPSQGWSLLHGQTSDHHEGSTLATELSYAASELSRHPENDSSFGSCSFQASMNSSYRASFDPSLLSHCGRELDFDDDSMDLSRVDLPNSHSARKATRGNGVTEGDLDQMTEAIEAERERENRMRAQEASSPSEPPAPEAVRLQMGRLATEAAAASMSLQGSKTDNCTDAEDVSRSSIVRAMALGELPVHVQQQSLSLAVGPAPAAYLSYHSVLAELSTVRKER